MGNRPSSKRSDLPPVEVQREQGRRYMAEQQNRDYVIKARLSMFREQADVFATQKAQNTQVTLSVQMRHPHAVQTAQVSQKINDIHKVPSAQKQAKISQTTQTELNRETAQKAQVTLLEQTMQYVCPINLQVRNQNVQNAQVIENVQNTHHVPIVKKEFDSPNVQTAKVGEIAQATLHAKQMMLKVPATRGSQHTKTVTAQNERVASCTAAHKENTESAQTRQTPPTYLLYPNVVSPPNKNSGDMNSGGKLSPPANELLKTNEKIWQHNYELNADTTVHKKQAMRDTAVTTTDFLSRVETTTATVPNLYPKLNNPEKSNPTRNRVFVNSSKQTEKVWNNTKDKQSNCSTCKMKIGLLIYECYRRHSSCSGCEDRPCGICGNNISFMKSLVIERNDTKKKVPCPHSGDGCKLYIKESEIDAHTKECPFKGPHCPVECFLISGLKHLSLHFDIFHLDQNSANVGSEMRLNVLVNSQKTYILVVDNLNFLFHVIVSTCNRRIYMAVQLLSTKFNPLNWFYEVKVYSNIESHRNVTFTEICTSYSKPVANILKECNCCVIPYVYASTFNNDGFLTYKFFIKRTKQS